MFSKVEINDFARKLNSLNKAMIKAIYMSEELIRNPVYLEYLEWNEEVIGLLAKSYKKLNKDNNDFADTELHGATFDSLKELANKLSNSID